MLTPSPLRRRPLFPHDRHKEITDEDDDSDADIFLQSPFKSPYYRFHPHPVNPLADDDEGGIFLSAPAQPFPSFKGFPSSSSQPLRTPVKQVHRTPSHSLHLNAQPHTSKGQAFGGTKRKESSAEFSTPFRDRLMTPLGISSAQNMGGTTAVDGGVSFDRLAPLPAPRFTTPQHAQSKAETEVHLKKHTETMTKLRIRDLDDDSDSDDEVVVGGERRTLGLFSRCAGGGLSKSTGFGADGAKSHAKGGVKGKLKSTSIGRSLGASLLAIAQTKKGKSKTGEVAEAISPDGHVIKRRARSRPVSQELLESVVGWSPNPNQVRVHKSAMIFS
jgi:mitosis inhibitor protein kinase SWE1